MSDLPTCFPRSRSNERLRTSILRVLPRANSEVSYFENRSFVKYETGDLNNLFKLFSRKPPAFCPIDRRTLTREKVRFKTHMAGKLSTVKTVSFVFYSRHDISLCL